MTYTVESAPQDFKGAVYDATGLTGPSLDSAADEIWNIAVRPRIPEPAVEVDESKDRLNEAIQTNLDHQYRNMVERAVSRLRGMVEEIEREGLRIPTDTLPDGTEVPDYTRAARDIVHLLHWGIANAHVDQIVDAAYQADRAFRNPQ